MSPYVNNPNINHGTAVAITAAGKTNNNIGKSSIGYNSDLLLYGMSYNHMLEATYAGARVLNISWASGCSFNSYYQIVIDEVYNNGTVIVAAAGNGPTCGNANSKVYPASFNNVISVSSVGPNNNHERFQGDPNSTHQHNDSVDLVAPGYDIALSIANNVYLTGNGTSFAAPYVTGTIGLMLAVNPCLTPAEVEYILKTTAFNVDGVNPAYAGMLGAGRINAAAAVQMAEQMIPIDFTVIVSDQTCYSGNSGIAIYLNSGDTSTYTVHWNDGSHAWTRTNLTTGTYSFTISSPGGCSIYREVHLSVNGPFFDYPNSVFIQDGSAELQDVNGDGVINIRGTIVIENGVNYEISGKTVRFSTNSDLPVAQGYPYSGIVVKSEASLNILNTSFDALSSCVNEWGGIELWNQTGSPATLSMLNSSIKNAAVAVANISKSTMHSNGTMPGGIISIEQNLFENNRISVLIDERIGERQFHEVVNNSFLNSAGIQEIIYLNLKNTNNIKVEKNKFRGNNTLVRNTRGTAIRALDSEFNIYSVKPFVQDSSYNNIFEDLYEGMVFINHSKSVLGIKAQNNLFANVINAVIVQGAFSGDINSNAFELPEGNTNTEVTGIVVAGSEALNITANSFQSINENYNYGIRCIANSSAQSTIKLNDFQGAISAGIVFEGENNFKNISCNTFDLMTGSDWIIDNDAQGNSGNLIMANALKLNIFSEVQNVNYQISLSAGTSSFLYEDAVDYLPTEISTNVSLEGVQVQPNWENQCILNTEEIIGTQTTGIAEEKTQEEKALVYPNPSNGTINLNVPENMKLQSIQILNSDGRVLENRMHTNGMKYDLTHLAAGTYFIAMLTDHGIVQTERLIVQ